jgi:hypothetical protein
MTLLTNFCLLYITAGGGGGGVRGHCLVTLLCSSFVLHNFQEGGGAGREGPRSLPKDRTRSVSCLFEINFFFR